MLLGCIADDFTGASDLANTLSREGMSTRLFIGMPPEGETDCDAGVVALKSRSIAASEAVAQSLDALRALRALGCRQFLFKYCSTFDSTPAGNIGPVAEALARELGVSGVVVCPAFPGAGRTVYQGHLFVGDRLLSESGMERHPLTPMTDPDLRRVLARQSASSPGHVPLSTVRVGPEAIAAALGREAAAGATLVVVDAVEDADLRAIGRASGDAALLTGGSGIAIGLPANFLSAGLLRPTASGFRGQDGDVAILAGSCSGATRDQVERHRGSHPSLMVDLGRLLGGEPVEEEAFEFLLSNRGGVPLVYSSASPEEVRRTQDEHGESATAAAVEGLFGDLAERASAAGFRRLVIAGGETSGAVVRALGLQALDIGPEIAPGVPALSARGLNGPLALALKSGNFGGPGFFSDAVEALGGTR